MKAIVFDKPGDESVLKLGDAPDPVPGPNELLIDVRCASVNRADLMQRQGFYPAPPGASPVLGLDCAGEIIAKGDKVTGWSYGQRAMALLAGGGYAQKVTVDAGSVIRLWLNGDGGARVREPRRPRPTSRPAREMRPEPRDQAVG